MDIWDVSSISQAFHSISRHLYTSLTCLGISAAYSFRSEIDWLKAINTININKKPVPNKADAICLSTFSSHANFDDLIAYGSNLRTNKLILVHGDADAKENLKKKLKESISSNDKTYKVVCSEKDMIVNL